ncbi:MAG: hypothetical protein PWQ96_1728 [Clostridia bacterium]|jgi:threonine/homoserine/homoserine lactone efflux protein|nr:putative threonine efflux protein [Clostridiales bacterium]MDK2986084.1 hypothetical protein [Clostridia bacterium]
MVFIKAAVTGFVVSLPVGPVHILCIRRSLSHGRLSGFVSGLGAATVDGIYAGISAGGLSVVRELIIREEKFFYLIGGIFLCFLALKTYLSQPYAGEPSDNNRGLVTNYVSTLVLTASNPMLVLGYAAVFAGAAIWWYISSGIYSLFRNKLADRLIRWVNRISAIVIMLFGLATLARLVI